MINVDSTIHGQVLSAARAAKMLGVKRQTLYAYASRGLLRRVPAPAGRGSGYLREDVERLKARSAARSGHGPVAAGALRWGEPVLDSAITSIDERGPAYRGHVAVDLAKDGATFEQIAELLWTGIVASPGPTWRPMTVPAPVPTLDALLRGRSAVARFSLLVPALWVAARRRPREASEASEAQLAHARGLIASLARFARTGAPESVASAIARSLGARREAEKTVNLALVVIADHELNASSFAARVAASAGADLHACLSAALATVSGTRHGGECDRVEHLLAQAGGPGGGGTVVRARIQAGNNVPGFGHPLYPGGDPRATPLLEAARTLSPRRMAVVDRVIDATRAALGLAPTVDMGLVAIARALGMPRGSAAALFALGRTAGWVAHVLEQREAGYILRPRARYVGVSIA